MFFTSKKQFKNYFKKAKATEYKPALNLATFVRRAGVIVFRKLRIG
jgi:hypothetical protein